MAIKNILVHADNSVTCEHRINAAIKLAQEHDAELTSIFVLPDYFMPTYYEAQISPEIIEQNYKIERQRAQESQSNYERLAGNADLSMQTVIEQGNPISTLSAYARFSDVLVLGQNHPEDLDNMSEALADNVVLEGGTPCLVIPYKGFEDSIGKRILVAWNASRESARVVKDAIPVLQQAEQVEILSINPEQDDVGICAYLKQHGVESKILFENDNRINHGDSILSHASEIDADMIVMGAYGHSRFRELVLGGATRYILQHMTIPVFISH